MSETKSKSKTKSKTKERKNKAHQWPAKWQAMKYHVLLDEEDEKKFDVMGCWASEKKDGIWSRWFEDQLWSKNKMLIQIPKMLQHVLQECLPGNYIIEGEWMKKEQILYVFDGYFQNLQNQSFEERWLMLQDLFQTCLNKNKKHIKLLKQTLIQTPNQWMKMKQKAFQNIKMEGYVLKKPFAQQEFGKRSRMTVKWKPWHKAHATIKKWTSNPKSKHDSCEIETIINKHFIKRKIHHSQLIKSQYPVGSKINIIWNGLTDDGKPEFIRFDS